MWPLRMRCGVAVGLTVTDEKHSSGTLLMLRPNSAVERRVRFAMQACMHDGLDAKHVLQYCSILTL